MTYTKPELVVLGEATCTIESTLQKPGASADGSKSIDPAYDLDE